jgi:hypothetical protein
MVIAKLLIALFLLLPCLQLPLNDLALLVLLLSRSGHISGRIHAVDRVILDLIGLLVRSPLLGLFSLSLGVLGQ